MSLGSILDALRLIPARRRASFRPRLEPLDERCLPSFANPVNYAVGTNPQAVATGHFNNDPYLDLVTANAGDDTVSVRLGDGQGGFGPATHLAVGSGPASVAVGDFDGDGNLDVATANRGGWDVSVLLGDGDGTFDAPVSTAVSSGEPTSLAVGDFDADGKMDLAVGTTYYYVGFYYGGGYDYNYVEVLMDYGDDPEGGFGTQTSNFVGWGYSWGYSTGTVVGVAVGDLDGDLLRDDVAAVNTSASTVSVLLGGDDGSLGWAGEFATSGSPSAVAIGDFTGDTVPDLVVAGSRVEVLPGDGAGMFGAPVGSGSGFWTAVAAGDLNGDGNLDAVAVNQSAGTVSTFLGLGGGMLFLSDDHPAGAYPAAVALGHFNGDGRTDAAVANAGSDDVSVLLNDGSWPSLDSQVKIGDVTVTEGHAGTVAAKFLVTLTTPSAQTVTVSYATASGSATAGSDYQAASGTVTFLPGQTSKEVVVPVLGDRRGEPDETFTVVLTSAQNAPIADGVGVGTIRDDEPRISITGVSIAEGNNGTKTMTFTVALSRTYDQSVTVRYNTANGTATTANRDYDSKSGTVTFSANQLTKTITVKIRGDKKVEPDEYFYVDLYGPSTNALIDISRGVGWILNDD